MTDARRSFTFDHRRRPALAFLWSDNMKHENPIKLNLPIAEVFLPLRRFVRFRGIHGGRGSGKSHFAGEDLIEDCLCNHVRAVCAREVQNSIKDSSKQLLEDKITLFAHHYSGAKFSCDDPTKIVETGDPVRYKHFMSKWRITEREIIYKPTDSLIIFRGLQNHTAASIKSLEGFNRLWGEEAQTLSQRSLDLAIPTFRSGSMLTFTWNPEDNDDPIMKLFDDSADDPDFVKVEANFYDNPWFPEELRRDMLRDKRRDPDKYAHVWLGKTKKNSAARVFKNYEVREFEAPRYARFYFGADWGFSVDPTVAVRAFIGVLRNGKAIADPDGDCLFVDYEAYKVGCEIDNTPALFAGDDKRTPKRWENPHKSKGIPDILKWPITADSARPETIAYMRARGFSRMKPAVKGAGSVEEGIEFLKNYDIVVHPRCKHTIDELNKYCYKIDPKTQEILPILEDKKNHVIDSLRYALEGTRRSSYSLDNVS